MYVYILTYKHFICIYIYYAATKSAVLLKKIAL